MVIFVFKKILVCSGPLWGLFNLTLEAAETEEEIQAIQLPSPSGDYLI